MYTTSTSTSTCWHCGSVRWDVRHVAGHPFRTTVSRTIRLSRVDSVRETNSHCAFCTWICTRHAHTVTPNAHTCGLRSAAINHLCVLIDRLNLPTRMKTGPVGQFLRKHPHLPVELHQFYFPLEMIGIDISLLPSDNHVDCEYRAHVLHFFFFFFFFFVLVFHSHVCTCSLWFEQLSFRMCRHIHDVVPQLCSCMQ